MSTVIIHGSANSQFLRTARMACEEKGVAYELQPVGSNTLADLKSEAHKKLHPFGRIPVLAHGDFTLFETSAIARYVDEAFDGPALQPADVKDRAVMNQWISAINHYLVDAMIFNFVAQFAFPSGPDGTPDMAKIEAAKPRIREYNEILDRHLDGRTYLAGDAVTIADLLLAPIGHYVGSMPGGLPLFDGLENLGRWWYAMEKRDSFQATKPPMLEQQAA